ncbi:galactose mutarotase [Parasteatoda tepidariorum]|uniref:galactose mutarotase n=1 Tax=Parasteatoda tepidariorum TaxID=114398 RepID=UPI00077FAB1E|nr:galactose mutarotase [Parasteatoda tepidariorum]
MVISIEHDVFGVIKSAEESREIIRFKLTNNVIVVHLITYGASIISLKIPGKDGALEDIVLGFDDLSSYITHTHYFGSTIGRCANRIAGARFHLNKKVFNLAPNNGKNHLHGGMKGFDKVVWDWKIDGNRVSFNYTSPSMEENYPGDLNCKVTYELTEKNELIIDYEATTNQATPINLTNHSYFNLAGHGSGTVEDHVISINADSYTPVDDSLIPTGEIADVESTEFDLRQPKLLGPLLQKINGFDHNFCVNGSSNQEREVARVCHPPSGRVMEVFSTQPGVQFYTGNCLPEDDSLIGKQGRIYKKYGALCLETQNYPNAINQPNFPNCVLDTNELYRQTTRLLFTTS